MGHYKNWQQVIVNVSHVLFSSISTCSVFFFPEVATPMLVLDILGKNTIVVLQL